MPRVEIVDMRGRYEIFSEKLLDALEECLATTRAGGHSPQQARPRELRPVPEAAAGSSSAPTAPSRSRFTAAARSCCATTADLSGDVPDACPRCGEYKIVHRGVGTERVEMELMNLLPGRQGRPDGPRHHAGRAGHLAVLEKFSSGEKDILLGTQMVAKGHHYPNVTLIGVLAADRGLHFPDFRSAEKTFRLLFQAAGRTGRGEKGGKVLIQTYARDHFIYEYLVRHDYEGFAARELEMRRALGYPPAGKLMLVTLSARSPAQAASAASLVATALEEAVEGSSSEILGPTPALIERLRGRHRLQILVKGSLDP